MLPQVEKYEKVLTIGKGELITEAGNKYKKVKLSGNDIIKPTNTDYMIFNQMVNEIGKTDTCKILSVHQDRLYYLFCD